MTARQRDSMIIGLSFGCAILVLGGFVFHLIQPKPKVVPGGSVSIELNGVDDQFLNQVQQVPSPQAADPSYGGSAVQQSPQYGVDTWKTLLQNELQ